MKLLKFVHNMLLFSAWFQIEYIRILYCVWDKSSILSVSPWICDILIVKIIIILINNKKNGELKQELTIHS